MPFALELAGEALKNLNRHKLRSLLTTLGIVFGIASVVAMVAIGEGAERTLLKQIETLGVKNIIINARKPPREQVTDEQNDQPILEYGLTFRDVRQIEQTLTIIDDVLPVHDVQRWIWFKSRRIPAKIRGVTPLYFSRLAMKPWLGRTLSDVDEVKRNRVCVIRSRLLREARYVGDPLQLDLKVGSEFFRVVGVLEDFEFQSPNTTVLGVDEKTMEVYVPFQTVIDRIGVISNTGRSNEQQTRIELHQIVCTVDLEQNVIHAARGIGAILDALHKIQDYEIIVPLELLQSRQRTQEVFNIVLRVIAGISLLVGGIGIMNIMLASVTERTAEIGLRRAIGASSRDITSQFLIETVTLAAVGGLLGIIVGIAGAQLIRTVTQWEVIVTTWAIALALTISCVTGVVFGMYPARRAAQMDPIEALRHG